MNDSYFPIRIVYTDNWKDVVVVKSPADIENKRPFRVIETRVKDDDNEE